MERWWWRIRHHVRGVVFPLLCLQFARTLLIPTSLDIIVLFVLFLIYIGFLLNKY